MNSTQSKINPKSIQNKQTCLFVGNLAARQNFQGISNKQSLGSAKNSYAKAIPIAVAGGSQSTKIQMSRTTRASTVMNAGALPLPEDRRSIIDLLRIDNNQPQADETYKMFLEQVSKIKQSGVKQNMIPQISLNNKVAVSNLRENSFKPSMFIQDRLSNLKNVAARASGKTSMKMDTVDKVLEKNFQIIGDVEPQTMKKDFVDESFASKMVSSTGGPSPGNNGDDDEDDKKLDEILNDNSILIKTFQKAQKVIQNVSPEDTVGVGKTQIVIPNFMKTYSQLFVDSKMMENLLPRKIETAEQLKAFNPYLLADDGDYDEADYEGVNEGVLNLAYDLLDSGGKRWRPVLGMMFAECFGRDIQASIEKGDFAHNEDILYACALTEIIHNGSLMADDLEDKSLMRRGKPCTYLQYGEDYAVNTSTLMYIAPIIQMKTYIKDADKRQAFQDIYQEEMFNIHFGQNWDIHWHNGKKMPTEAQYIQMIINKTSVLPRLCARLIGVVMDLSDEQTQAICKYTVTLGAAFQIQDDLIALTSQDYAKERGSLGEDIHEGKRTLMVLNAYDPKNTNISQDEKDRLVEILDMGTNDDEIIMEAIDILHKSGSIEYGFKKSKEMLNEAWSGLAPVLPESKTKDQLRQLSEYLVNRDL